MDADDAFVSNISRRTDVDTNGYLDVIAHGTPNGIQITHLFYPGHSLFIKAEIHFSGSEESQVPYGEVFLAFRFYSETVLHTFPQ